MQQRTLIMASILSQVLLAGVLLFGCQTFAQSGPNLVVNGKVIPFDPKYVTPVDEESGERVIGQVRTVIDKALAKGVSQVGALDLRKLRREIQTVKILIVNFGAQAVGVGKFTMRLGSVYFSETKSLYLNQNVLFSEARAWPMLIHEFLGALGYNDENYQLSSLILSENPRKNLQPFQIANNDLGNRLVVNPSQKLHNLGKGNALKSGGTTVIGGGGDEIMLAAKVYMIDKFDFFKDQLLPVLLQDPSIKKDIKEKFGLDPQDLLQPEAIHAYFRYFIETPFEVMTSREGVAKAPITDPNDVNKISGVYANEFSKGYVRLSRDHWDWSIGNLPLETSRMAIMANVHIHLLSYFLESRSK